MIRKLYLLLLLSLTTFAASAQSVELDVETIRGDRENYISGEGKATSLRKATSYALEDIINQISVTVKSDFLSVESEGGNESESELNSKVESIINSYSSATLTNTQRIIISNEPEANVFLYIKRTEVERIFEARKLKALSMCQDAERALSKRQINDALRYYYWAHALIKSLRYPNEVVLVDSDGVERMANTWIPNQINDILSDLSIKISDVNDSNVTLAINHNGEKVRSVDYTYFDGFDWSNIYTAKDGIGVVELRKSVNLEDVQLKIEYAFEGESVMDPELSEVLSIVGNSIYKKAYVRLSMNDVKEDEQSVEQEVEAITTDSNSANSTHHAHTYPELGEVENIESYQSNIKDVLTALLAKRTDGLEEYFTEEGYNNYKQLIGYGAARIVDVSEPRFYSLGDDVFCRNIFMNFAFSNNRRSFIENVVFKFDKEQKISNVSFGLNRDLSEEIFTREQWPEQARIILIHFLEGYKTSYALKQIDYIESVFAEDALIITGSTVRAATQAEVVELNSNYVRYTTHSKSEYVNKLKYIFRNNEFININFADSQVMKGGKGGEVYGIQIKQDYHSSTYGDTGYLFLLVDLTNIDKPIIHVRTWQPDKDPDFGVYGLQSF